MIDPKSDYMFLDSATLTPTPSGLRMRPFSIASYNLIQRLGIRLGGEQSEAEQMRHLAAVAWIQSAPIAEVLAAANAGTAWDAIDAFMFTIDLSEVSTLSAELERIGAAVAASSFDIQPKPGDKEENTPPN